MRERLLAEARTRLEQFAASQDPALAAGPEVPILIRDLLGDTSDPGADLEVAYVAGVLSLYRHLVLRPDGDQELSEALRLLGPVNQVERAALPDSVRHYLEAGDLTSIDLGKIAGHVADLARNALATGDRPGLDRAIEWLRQVLRSAPAHHRLRPQWLSNLGAALHARFQWSGTLADLDEAVRLGRESVAAARGGHPERAACLGNLAAFLGTRFGLSRFQADLDELIALTGEALRTAGDDCSDRGRWLSNLCGAWQQRFELTGLPADLDAAVEAGRGSVAAGPTGSSDLAAFLFNFASALQARFEWIGVRADLDEAVAACRHFIAVAPHAPGRPRVQTKLGSLLLARYEATGALADIDETISVVRDAADGTPCDDPDRVARLANLGNVLQMRFDRTGIPADLDHAIAAFRTAVTSASSGDPERPRALSGLGNVLHMKFEQAGRLADLDEAVAACREALAAAPSGTPRPSIWLSHLGVALRARFGRTGVLADIDEAVAAGRAAVEASPPGHRDQAVWLSNLGVSLRTRFDRTGAMADLDAAIEALRAAAVSGNRRIRTEIESNLALTLLDRFERTAARADLEDAITACRGALAATQADLPQRAKRLAMLGAMLRVRSELMDAPADLEEAVSMSRAALAAAPSGSPDLTGILTNLSLTLRSKNRRTGAPADLDEAITTEREALLTVPADDPDRAVLLTNLGTSLRFRFTQTGAPEDLDEAITAGRQAAAIKAASPVTRAGAARGWGLAAGTCERWPEAATAFEEAVMLLGQAAPRSLDRQDQEFFLQTMTGLASDAAACCVHAGLVDRAIELLEQGRGVLLGQALDIRTDLTEVRELHPDLAERFAALRDELAGGGGPGRQASALLTAGRAFLGDGAEAERRKKAAAEFDRVIADIRAKPGLASFLRPLPVGELTAAAADGPVAVINASRFGSHALILTTDGVRALPLDGLTPERVELMATEFQAAFNTWSEAGTRRMAAVFGWLWDTVCGPVLTDLGIGGRPAEGSWPRIWWCAAGRLSFLPLHAAGHHHTRSDPVPRTVIDRAVSSYAPTVRSLMHARRPRVPPGASGQGRVVVVAMPDTPEEPRLPGAAAEAELIQRRFGSQVQALVGEEARYQTVIKALPGARWAHFACHSEADLRDPSASRLLLTDHRQRTLTVMDILRLHLEGADFAFLSACSTARPGQRLADEAIHLTAAFQLAGFRHVIGTLWPIDDATGLEIADAVYQEIAGDWTADRTPMALHAITVRLRNRMVSKPWLWAAHVHSGR